MGVAGRLGFKRSLIGNWLSATAGFGGGTFFDVRYISPDLGLIASYENRHFTPFVSVRGGFSHPLNAVDAEFMRFEPNYLQTTGFYGVGIGSKIPIDTAALLVGVQWQHLLDREKDRDVPSVGVAMDWYIR